MKLTRAAVFEPRKAERKRLIEGLRKAGLRISEAEGPDRLAREQLVVLGPTFKNTASAVREIRKSHPATVVLAARRTVKAAAPADGVLPLPLSPRDLQARLPELSRLRARQAETPRAGQGIADPLTHFYTFNHFKEVLFIEVKRARRYGFPLTLGLVAFDPLPGRLDRETREQLHGGLALAIRRSLRDTDYPVQYKSERILMLMPHTDLPGALVVSRRICERVARASLTTGTRVLRPTISVGISAAASGPVEFSFSDIVARAQTCLEAAMAAGGNRVEFADAGAESGSTAPAPERASPGTGG